MKQKIANTLLVTADILLIVFSYIIAFGIRFEGNFFNSSLAMGHFETLMNHLVVLILIKLAVFWGFGLYSSLWRYASIEELLKVINASFFASAATLSYLAILQQHLPRSIYVLVFILDILLAGGLRFSYRTYRFFRGQSTFLNKGLKRVMIFGAGQAGAMVIKELKNHPELKSKPVAFVDDDPYKIGRKINGVPVLGRRNDIEDIVEIKKIDEIIIAVPGANKSEIRKILEICGRTKCKLKILPGIYELIDGRVTIKEIRNVEIEDLLGRDPVKVDLEQICGYLNQQTVLVTGGGGSIGSELCRQIASFSPRKLIILDIYENNAYEIQHELQHNFPELSLEVLIGSVRDLQRMKGVFQQYMPDVVFHAAAHKHVPLMEQNPQEAIKNNIFGTQNVAQCAHEFNTKRFVLISTDKAVNPTNIMGATKRVAEMIIQSLDKVSRTEFVAVRFGNVLGSNGSVIPLFKKQIEQGGPLTVTDPEVTRFFMTIPEAVQLVIQAGAMASGGEIFVLDMGEPVKIIDLAENLIRLSGYEPYKDIDIEICGLRPGEKLYEELLMDEEGLESTKHEKIFVAKPVFTDLKLLYRELEILNELLLNDRKEVKNYMEKIVPTYKQTS